MKTSTDRKSSASISRRGVVAAGAAATVATALPGRRARAADTVRVGLVVPLSGYLASLGQACLRGAEIALPFLKERGYDMVVVNRDSQSSPDVGRTQAEALIRDGANILMGCFDSATSAAVAQVAEQHKTPFVINVGADPAITKQGYKYVFRNFPTAVMLGQGGLQLYKDLFAASGATPKSAVLLYENDSFGMAMIGGIKALAPRLDLPFQIKDMIAYDPQATDLSIEVAKAKAAQADLTMVITRANDAVILIREMVKQRYETMGIISPGSPGMYEREFTRSLGKYAEDVITNAVWFDPHSELATMIGAAFKKQYPNDNWDLDAGFTVEAMMICADAAKRAGSVNPDDLVAALKTTNIKERLMIGGPITFGPDGQTTTIQPAAIEIIGGQPTVVLPAQFAAHKPIFPMVPFAKR